MKAISKIAAVLLLLNLVLMAYLAMRNPEKEFSIKTTTTKKTIYQDTGSHTVKLVPVPVRIVEDTNQHYRNVDTFGILKNYFSSIYYDSTIVNDTSMFIRFTGTVSHNRLDSFSVEYKNRRPIQIVTNTTTINTSKFQVFMNLRPQILPKFDLSIGTDVIYLNKIYGFDYSPLTKSASVKLGLLIYNK